MNSPEPEPEHNFADKGECILTVLEPLVNTSKHKTKKIIIKSKDNRTKPATILTS